MLADTPIGLGLTNFTPINLYSFIVTGATGCTHPIYEKMKFGNVTEEKVRDFYRPHDPISQRTTTIISFQKVIVVIKNLKCKYEI
jgi:hypothetical protein